MLGANCVVCVPYQKELTSSVGEALFNTIEYSDLIGNKGARNFDLIHAWTPREAVRKFTYDLVSHHQCRIVIHLEDNEEYLIESLLGFSVNTLRRLPNFILDLIVPSGISHPRRYRDFLDKADGITVVTESLKEFCPSRIPLQVLWAGYQGELNWASPLDLDYKRKLGIADTDFVLVYTGNVHVANRTEVSDLYKAIEIVNVSGLPLKLVRTGLNYSNLSGKNLDTIRKKYCIELGHVPRKNLPKLLSIADILVQPGVTGRFNDYRFPSKLPEYLASGKPVILPKTNIGLILKDREECLLLDGGNDSDIAEKIKTLLSDARLRNRVGVGGRLFAERNLRWDRIAEHLHDFYKKLLSL